MLTMELLDMTDFKYAKVRGLDIYVRPYAGETLEVLVFDCDHRPESMPKQVKLFSPILWRLRKSWSNSRYFKLSISRHIIYRDCDIVKNSF